MTDSADIPTVEGIEGLTLVGRGGFAAVYRGHQPAFRRDVAVKVIQRSGLDADDRRRFERECQAMGALSNHPAIVTLFDAGFTEAGQPYLVMEYVSDGTLHDRLATGGPMSWQEASALGVRLAGALETSHRAGVLHRDIKPANVLHARYGDQLSDFGIARIQGGHETRSGVITASVAHAAPEILDGYPPTAQADVYALASTVYEALTGRAAFMRDTDEGMLPLIRRVLTDLPPDLRERGVPDAVATVVERAMEKDPAARYPSAEAFGLALRGAQAVLGIGVTDLAIVGDRGLEAIPDGSTSAPSPGVDSPSPSSPVVSPPAAVAGFAADATVGVGEPSSALPSGPTIPGVVPPPTADGPPENGTKKAALIGGVLLAVVAVIGGVVVATRGGDEASEPVPTAETTIAEVPASAVVDSTVVPATTPADVPATSQAQDDTGPDLVQVGIVAPPLDESHPFLDGLRRAADDFGVELTTDESGAAADEQLFGLISAGHDPIIVLAQDPGSEEIVAAVAASAQSHPEVTFIVLDAEVDAPNVVSMVFAENEGSFLMGVIAAKTSKTGRVGFLGGSDTARTQGYEAGYVAGVRHVSPSTQVDVRYLPGAGENYADVDAASALAIEMFEAGADVIYHSGTSGVGLFDAAAAGPGRWAIGVDTDQALTADPAVSDRVLTSMVKRYGEVAYGAISSVVGGETMSGVEFFGVADEAVWWSTTGGHIAVVAPEAKAVSDQIVAGEIIVPDTVRERALAPLGATCPPEGCQIRIVDITPADSELMVTLEANWILKVAGMHAHYFWYPRYSSAQVGGDSAARFGVAVGDWDLDDSYPVYVTEGAVSLSVRGDDNELCVTPADANHNVLDPNLFDCFSLAGLV